ncbi:MAG: branched-chain amino acid ABC transporter permease [Deinococcales bacterium]
MKQGFWRDLFLALLIFIALAFLPTGLRQFFGKASVSYVSLAIAALSLATLALSWDILVRTGQLSLAHAAFYGAGAYSTAILLKLTSAPLWLGTLVAGLVAVLLALALGWVTLRLHGIYFAIATLSFSEVLKAVVHKLPTAIAGGAAGINVEPLFRPTFIAGQMERWEIAYLRNERYFYVFLALLALAVILSLIIQHSRLRYAFSALRTNEAVARVMGIQPARYKLLAFVMSSWVVGMLGAVSAHRLGSVNPDESFSVFVTVLALVTPIFGGLYSTLGPIIGALGLSSVEELLKRSFSDGYLIGYGIVLVLSVLFMPKGILGLFTQFRKHLNKEEPSS